VDAEHKRPFAAFLVVSAASALLLGQSLHSQAGPGGADRPAASQASGEATRQLSPSAGPANGQAVEGITAAPTYPPVKSIGDAPMLMAREDDDLDIALGAVHDPDGKLSSPTGGVRTGDSEDASPGPQGSGPSETPEPGPSGGPDEDGDSQGSSGGHSQGPDGKPPRGPRNDDVLPTPQLPDPRPAPSGSATARR
jgi:hypothetical protein